MWAAFRDNVLFLAVAVLLAYGIYQTAGTALGTDVPVVAVTSGSMEPTLHRGDMIVVRGVPFSHIEAGQPGKQDGDIVVFRTADSPVPIIHRAIRKNSSALQTKGDNAQQHPFETYVTPEQVRGVAVATVPLLGHVKLVPTCLLLELQGQRAPLVCPSHSRRF